MASAAAVPLVYAAVALAAPGQLAQPAGLDGCLTATGTGGTCTVDPDLDGANALTISPDGRFLYVAVGPQDRVLVFSRNATTGRLTRLAGDSGCVSNNATAGCVDVRGLDGPTSIVITADGESAYINGAVSDTIAVFDRNPSSGAITQLPGEAGCVAEVVVDGCADANGINFPRVLAAAPDGRFVYATAVQSDAITIYERDPVDGSLQQLPGVDGCIADVGDGVTCADARGLDSAVGVAVSPDGRSAYVTAAGTSNALLTFGRDPVTGKLTQPAGAAGCVSDTGSGGDCADGRGLTSPILPAISPDGEHVYVAAQVSDAVTIFDRDPASGEIAQLPGTTGCVSRAGVGGCGVGRGLDGAIGLTVRADGKALYTVASGSAAGQGYVATFGRDAATGRLSQFPGTAACVAENGGDGCADGRAIDSAFFVVASPDGRHLYTAANVSDGVAIFAIEQPPAPPTPKPPTADTDPPATTISSGPRRILRLKGRAKRATVRFRFRSDEAGSKFRCRLQRKGSKRARTVACKSPRRYRRLKPGRYTFTVVATDPAGNADRTPAKRSFRILRAKRKR